MSDDQTQQADGCLWHDFSEYSSFHINVIGRVDIKSTWFLFLTAIHTSYIIITVFKMPSNSMATVQLERLELFCTQFPTIVDLDRPVPSTTPSFTANFNQSSLDQIKMCGQAQDILWNIIGGFCDVVSILHVQTT